MGLPQEAQGLTAEDLDARIHALTAIQILNWFKEGDMTAGQMQCVLRFLKDNDVTSLPIPGGAMAQITERMGEDLPFLKMADRTVDARRQAEGSGPSE